MHIYIKMASCLLLLAAAGCHSRLPDVKGTDHVRADTLTMTNLEHAPTEILSIAKDSLRPKLTPITGTSAKNIILVILDGVSFNQILATRYHYYGVNGRLNMELLPGMALVDTHSADTAIITDSGAGATAMATGFKTLNGMLGMSPDGQSRHNLISIFQKQGKSTALATYGGLSGATPAAFATHTLTRENKKDITAQLLASGVDYLFGEAEDFINDSLVAARQSQTLAGYHFWRNKLPTAGASPREKQLVLYDSLVKEEASLTSNRVQLTPGAPSLAAVAKSALTHLSANPRGFFLMLEEDWTDSWGHSDKAGLMTWHLKNADDAIGELVAFARENKETLLLVTADHETGGLTIPRMSLGRMQFTVAFSSWEHTAIPVPLFSYGPGSSLFNGVIDNTEIFHILSRVIN